MAAAALLLDEQLLRLLVRLLGCGLTTRRAPGGKLMEPFWRRRASRLRITFRVVHGKFESVMDDDYRSCII